MRTSKRKCNKNLKMQSPLSYSLPAKAFIISFGKIINRLSALFAIIYLSYHLPKEDYGSYRQVWLLFNILVDKKTAANENTIPRIVIFTCPEPQPIPEAITRNK